MALLKFVAKGDFESTIKFLNESQLKNLAKKLEKYGQRGVEALSEATPVDTGKTAASWSYVVQASNKNISIVWKNSNVVNGYPIAIILQYGHATRNGGFVQGRDYINPAIQPIFDEILTKVWKEVVTA